MQVKADLIIIRGAPGSGKSETAKSMSKYFPKGVRIEVDTIRNMVISVDWINQQEHIDMLQASIKLVFEFLNFGFSPVIVIDTFSGDKINRYLESLYLHDEKLSIKIFGLYTSDEELKRRLDLRPSREFKDFLISKKLNEDVLKWKLDNEFQVDTTLLSPAQTAEKIFEQYKRADKIFCVNPVSKGASVKTKIGMTLLSLATADALGVPVEFQTRSMLKKNPVTGMLGHGSHDQPAGTWSDDSSLAFCLAEMLTEGYSLERLSELFVKWAYSGYWTPYGEVFDIGIATRAAMARLKNGVSPLLAGGDGERDNGNGSLMRILPLLLFIKDLPAKERLRITEEVSSLTHRHPRAIIACFYYLEFGRLLLEKADPTGVCNKLKSEFPALLKGEKRFLVELPHFRRILEHDIIALKEEEIHSSGYVIHTLEASIWCLLSTTSYKDAVLKAVNLGDDTDTTAAVTGGLAGLVYGLEGIPVDWLGQLARRKDIEDLAGRLDRKFFD